MRVWSITLKKNNRIYSCVGVGKDFEEALAFAMRNLRDENKRRYEVQCYDFIDIEMPDPMEATYTADNSQRENSSKFKQFSNKIKKL
jgi:hypothetical protein